MSSHQSKSPQKTQSTLSLYLYKSKILSSENPPTSFTLIFTLDSTTYKTQKISKKDYNFPSSSFSFKYSPKTVLPFLEISAEISSWVLFNSKIATLSIPLTPINLTNRKQWFYLKNVNDENILSILISLNTDYNDNSFIKKQSEISYIAQTHNDIFNSIFNRTMIQFDSNKASKHISYDSAMYNRITLTKKGNSNEEKILEYIQSRLQILNEEEKNIQLEKIRNNVFSDKIQEKNKILIKEREKLNKEKKEFNKKNKDYHKKISFIKHFELERELNDYNKECLLNLNFIFSMSSSVNKITSVQNKSTYYNNNNNKLNTIKVDDSRTDRIKQNDIKVIIKENPSCYKIQKKLPRKSEINAKKSVSTNANSTHSSGISTGDIPNGNSINKGTQISQIYLNTTISEMQREQSVIIDPLENLPKQFTRRKAVANQNNNNINFQRTSISQKQQNIKMTQNEIGNNNIKRKIKKKCVISLNSHKSINTSLYCNNKLQKMSNPNYVNSHGNILNNTFTLQSSVPIAQTTRNVKIRKNASKKSE